MANPAVGIIQQLVGATTCNMHLGDLAAKAKEGVLAAGPGGSALRTIGVSDGISMGTRACRIRSSRAT